MKAGILLLILFGCFNLGIQAQQTRGIKPIASKSKKGTTRAVIIGISDYQDPDITDLKYAHKDAEVFARYLLSPSGGNVKWKNIQLLLNEQATGAQISQILDKLVDSCKAGDLTIIYFAGHGDLESRLIGELGYLLPWDSPNRSYWMNGLKIIDLQNIINTLVLENKSKVILISDACHSGNLAGATIRGPSATLKSMIELSKNQILVLSCQPEEVSIEGEQWGGGRGLFSYYFVEGLYGLANSNSDTLVTVQEIERYLQDRVSPEAEKLDYIQTPKVMGNLKEILSSINQDSQKQVYLDKDKKLPDLSPVQSRFYDDNIIGSADTSVQNIFLAFEEAIRKKEFLFSVDGRPTADELYQRLIKEPSLKRILSYIGHNYAAALQDDAQQVLNKLLNVNHNEITKSKIAKLKSYKNYPLYLARASEILGEQHRLYRNLKARQYFFEGLMLFFENSGNKNIVEGSKIMEKFRQSLALEPYGPHTYFYMMYCQATKFKNKDSATIFAMEAMKCSQNWVLPVAYLSYFFSSIFKDTVEAKNFYNQAKAIDANHFWTLNAEATLYFYEKKYEQAISIYKKIAVLDSTNSVAMLNLGISNLSLGQVIAAEYYLNKTIGLDSTEFNAYYYLGLLNVDKSNWKEAEQRFLKALELNPNFIRCLQKLGELYVDQKRKEEAEKIYRKIVKIDPNNVTANYNLACLAALKNQMKESLEFLERALKNGFNNFNALMNDEDLTNIRKLDSFKLLLEKYKK